MDNKTISFLGLGDSYTIGEAVSKEHRWPEQLKSQLIEDNIIIDPLKIIAITGWTTDELLKAIRAEQIDNSWDLVSLSIGVNNQYRGYNIEQYLYEFEELIDLAIQFCKTGPRGVFVFSIPDYAYTPFSEGKDLQKISTQLKAYNKIAQLYCDNKQVSYYDITPLTQEGLKHPEYVTTDKLHPSRKMYTLWLNKYCHLIKSKI